MPNSQLIPHLIHTRKKLTKKPKGCFFPITFFIGFDVMNADEYLDEDNKQKSGRFLRKESQVIVEYF
jgi:hypothetical protein